jgi:glycosyltransferase involved in cell wall biosynthesis
MVGLPGIGRFITGLWGGLHDLGADVVGLWPGARVRHWLGAHHYQAAGPHVTVRARPFLALEQLAVPRVLRQVAPDVHHATHFNVPYATRIPVVLTIHDLIIYLDSSKARSRAAGAYYRLAVPRAIAKATTVVALSPFTARQITETFGIDGERLRCVEAGLDHGRWRPQARDAIESVRTRFGLPERYLLYVGTAKAHKNLSTLAAAHTDSVPTLVLAGPTAQELAGVGVEIPADGRVIVLGRVPDDVLPPLYAGARALVLPSLYEGLGLPPLEAMACGTPAVVSDGGALPETVGDAGMIVPARQVEAWREALRRISEDEPLRDTLTQAGFVRTAGLDWRTCARQYLDVYRETAERA